MLTTLRSRIVLASVLWTAGMLLLMHLASGLLVHRFPMPRGKGVLGAVAAGVVLMAAGFLAARRSLAPLLTLRRQVVAVRNGEATEIAGRFPAEVQPLIDSLNELIVDRERSIERAHAAAGDLAHCLKTPLALLAREADAAEAAGNQEQAGRMAEQIGRMAGQIDYQLARARLAATGPAGPARCGLGESTAGVMRAMSRLHADRRLEMASTIDDGLSVRMRREDLEEVLGNLLDNACKWARGRITVTAELRGAFTEVVVSDDGPGLEEGLRETVLRRGFRADEREPGTGLGLSIVRELVEHYGGSVAIEGSEWGGLAVRVRLRAG